MSESSGEQWLPVPGYEGLYEVSDHGRVRSLDRTIVDSLGRVCRLAGRVLHPSVSRGGYLVVSLGGTRPPQSKYVHVLVLTTFVDPRPEGHEGCHGNGVRAECDLGNLRWDTSSANGRDSVLHGTNHLALRTHCPREHELSLPNLVKHKLAIGRRSCLACAKAMSLIHYAERHGHQHDSLQALSDRFHARIMA